MPVSKTLAMDNNSTLNSFKIQMAKLSNCASKTITYRIDITYVLVGSRSTYIEVRLSNVAKSKSKVFLPGIHLRY